LLCALSILLCFWAIDEFSDPYSFIFKIIDRTPIVVEIPLKSRVEDEGTFVFNAYSVPKTRDVQLGAGLISELQDIFSGSVVKGWKSFVSMGVPKPFREGL